MCHDLNHTDHNPLPFLKSAERWAYWAFVGYFRHRAPLCPSDQDIDVAYPYLPQHTHIEECMRVATGSIEVTFTLLPQ